jgi:hypothetical protein
MRKIPDANAGRVYHKGEVYLGEDECVFIIIARTRCGELVLPLRHYFVVTQREPNCVIVSRTSRAKYRLLGGEERNWDRNLELIEETWLAHANDEALDLSPATKRKILEWAILAAWFS